MGHLRQFWNQFEMDIRICHKNIYFVIFVVAFNNLNIIRV